MHLCCLTRCLNSLCDFAQQLTNTVPYPEETANVKTLFWSTVIATWLLSFVRQNGRRNFSIVDRIWPLFPLSLLIQWIYDSGALAYPKSELSVQAKAAQCKAIVGSILVFVWGVRLCYNSIRRGDYAVGAEDYRWAVVRAAINCRLPECSALQWIVWELFNLIFISFYQLALLYLISVPLRLLVQYPAFVQNSTGNMAADGWSLVEVLLVLAMALLLVGEAVADQQMYNFQNHKKQGKLPKSDAGFVHSGLWKYSRHPNVACEQAFWAVLCVFCATATGTDLGSTNNMWLLAGPLLLIALMWGSVKLTENISKSKYPLYKAYQLQTNRLIPWKPWSNSKLISQAHAKL
ncbi:hypothetical protein H4R22_003949 [Coemansia sp. RSA 1290]|nr:hypothetical protein BX667DRAFT_497791 [Coemansia mojavensis]KAJ1740028.1 hypothetical protein LPJ68_004163 [Coemansia sp. RSA 1086]KAJ1750212.1 hypothetical protein LPJ79_003113 [Coemansia sp. RSA 1821]KAJ1871232.1 hypothetical protein LPJ55_004065 [Coemansia sp. RSA 990]KAJ2628323.1 hypothetical protein H4R22_003949 [Coemansia sp. RSA 1290]KAJ2649877.1 hypothetical protein IWW40_002888 [Coemansia sp. RSA 1250]KAJ2672637.1 hypothetical protein IWW42_002791 [Coemansia sp. RSA 1085]